MRHTPLKDVMVRNLVTLNLDKTFCDAAEIFRAKAIRHLPIVNAQGILMGLISQRDFNRVVSPERTPEGEYIYDMTNLAKFVLKEHVIHDVITLSEEDTLEKAVVLLAEKKLGCIPIVDESRKVIGIFTAIDALKLFLKTLREE